jgi:UDP-N-acetylglucosamine transferase subunit ALG13
MNALARHWTDRSGRLPAPDEVRILVTVGTELPFDRLVSAVERWAVDAGVADSVLAQVGETEHPPSRIAWTRILEGPEFHDYFEQAELVVSHAGMGTVISALQLGRPLLVMPRLYSLGEHRNDHQMATAVRLAEQERADVAMDESELVERLEARDITPRGPIGPWAEGALLDAVSRALRPSGEPVSPPDRSRRRPPLASSRRGARYRNRPAG